MFFGLFKSEVERGQERRSKKMNNSKGTADQVIEAIELNEAVANRLIDKMRAEQCAPAARALFEIVITTDRTDKGCEFLKQEITDMANRGESDRSFGALLALSLLQAGCAALKLKGTEQMNALFCLAPLEGSLRGFMTQNGVQPWEVTFAYDHEFERYRMKFLEPRYDQGMSTPAKD